MSVDDAHSPHSTAQKRRRVEEELQQDPEIWMTDGNVVLTAKDDDGIIWGFRCHKSVLSKHSTVFQGMFTLDQPDGAEMHDGLPVVALTDRSSDLKGLLQILYDPVEHLPDTSHTTPLRWQEDLRRITGPLRISKKYEFDAIHRKLVAFLELRWPMTLEGWDKVAETIEKAQDSSYDDPDESFQVNPISTIILADELGISSILPALYYTLHMSWRVVSFETSHDNVFDIDANAYPPEDLTLLPSHHHARLAAGNYYLRTATAQLLLQEIPKYVTAPCTQEKCRKVVKEWLERLFFVYANDGKMLVDPLSMFQAIRKCSEEITCDVNVCIGCGRRLDRALGACRRYIWAELPYFFDIKPREQGEVYGCRRHFEEAENIIM